MIKEELEELFADNIPFTSFMGKGNTSEILELCINECERQMKREAYSLLFGMNKKNYKDWTTKDWTTDEEGYACFKNHRVGDVEEKFKK